MSKNKLAIPRLTQFIVMLKRNQHPTHPSLVEEMQKIDIAGAYSITQKTLQRDVAFLRDECGAPIAYDYKARGYYLTDPTWSWDIPKLSDIDLESLFLALHLMQHTLPTSLRKQAFKAMDALLARFSGALQRLNYYCNCLTLSTHDTQLALFDPLFEAWRTHHRVRIVYKVPPKMTLAKGTFEPYIFFCHEQIWFVRGRMIETDTLQTLAFSTLREVLPTAETFEPNFTLTQTAATLTADEAPLIEHVTLRLPKSLRAFIHEHFQAAVINEDTSASLFVALPPVTYAAVQQLVFAWPGEIAVLEPSFLKESIAVQAEKLFRLHTQPTHPPTPNTTTHTKEVV